MSIRSSTGPQLERAELLAFDGEGKRIKPRRRGANQIPIRETRPTPNSTHGLEERHGSVMLLAKLTDDERAVLEEQLDPIGAPVVMRQRILAGKLAWHLKRGATFLPGTETEEDGATYVLVEVTARNVRSYETIGERLGLTARQVHRCVVSANRKLRP